MTKFKIRKMLLELIEELDYDHYKHFLPDCSEDPEAAEEQMGRLIEIVGKYIK